MAYPGQQPPVQPNMYNPTQLSYGPNEGVPPQSFYPPTSNQNMPPYPGNVPGGYPGAPPSHVMYPMPQPGFQSPGGYAPQGPYAPIAPPQIQAPITSQPMGMPAEMNWMNAPQRPINCPPGLEYLTMIDQLLVHQKVEILEAMVGFETCNKFKIKNSLGQLVYYAKEDSGCLTRNLCGPLRPFDMKIFDNFQNEVIHLYRPLACDSCCFPCCLQSMEISAPPGTVVGTVEQDCTLFIPSFTVKNEYGTPVLKITGPCCTFSICGDVDFKVMSIDGDTQVGKISKQWSGLLREAFTDADHFGITFPMDLDVKMKATLLGALFLIDAMYFEKTGNRD